MKRELPGLLAGLLLCALAAGQLDWLGAGLFDPIVHGENEDWDWQLGLYEATRRSLLVDGALPLWNPWVQGGVPLWANPEMPGLYPGFLAIVALGTEAGLKVWMLGHLWLLVWGAWLAGRELGLGPVAAHGAGLLTLCSAFVPGFIAYGHVMYLPLGWLPLAWVAQRRGHWPLAAMCLALPMLAGGHYLLVYGALWLGLDGLFRGLREERLRWLGAVLALNGLALGAGWAAWPLGLALLGALVVQRPQSLRRTLPPVVYAGLLCAGLIACRLTTAPALFERAERLAAQTSLSIADPYTPWLAWQVFTGAVERLSGHEGQNVFYNGVGPLVGYAGLCWAAWRRPALGVMGLTWWNLGWGGSTPVNLLEVLHRLPGFDHLRVVERYTLVWTLFLGWGLGFVFTRLRAWWGRVGGLALVAWVVWTAAPEAATAQRLGVGTRAEVAEGPFVQTDDELTSYQALRANRGKIDCWTTAWLEDPSPALRAVGHQGYRGEVWRPDGGVVEAELAPGAIRVVLDTPGRVVVNQNAFRGWEVDGRAADDHDGLLSAELPAGEHVFRYRPPGFCAGVLISLFALVAWAGLARSTARARAASGSAPR